METDLKDYSPAALAQAAADRYHEHIGALDAPAIDYEAMAQPSATTPKNFTPKGLESAIAARELKDIIVVALEPVSVRDTMLWGYRRMYRFTTEETRDLLVHMGFETMSRSAFDQALNRCDIRVADELATRSYVL